MSTFTGCPGSRMVDLREKEAQAEAATGKVQSQLRQWQIQLHLIAPTAPYYQGADVLLTADCVAYALGSYHADYLKGKSLAIACPKLDEGQNIYVEKIKSWFEDAIILNDLQNIKDFLKESFLINSSINKIKGE